LRRRFPDSPATPGKGRVGPASGPVS
jgi:hypothetical protein